MWKAHAEKLSSDKRKFSIAVDAAPMSFEAVLNAWHDDAGFRAFFTSMLIDETFAALRWETPALTHATLDLPFECGVINSPGLDASPDAKSFAEHFQKARGSGIVTFTNLGGDATLVVPVPQGPASAYGHIAAFLREAPDDQKQSLWIAVSEAMRKRVSAKPVWLSTAGAGVAWLHVRLDDRPKYYNHAPYRATVP